MSTSYRDDNPKQSPYDRYKPTKIYISRIDWEGYRVAASNEQQTALVGAESGALTR